VTNEVILNRGEGHPDPRATLLCFLTLIYSQHSLTSTLAVAFVKESCHSELVSIT